MEREKIFKKHENRNDLAGENALGDIGQVILLLIFLIVWISDSLFIKYSIQYADFAAPYVRIPLAVIILFTAGYLAKQGLTIVFAKVREKPVVIRKGVFSIVRHPIYLGAILFYLSLIVVCFSLIAALIWVIIILFYIYLCKHEEKLLIQKFGSDYETYKSETPMLLPRIIKRNK